MDEILQDVGLFLNKRPEAPLLFQARPGQGRRPANNIPRHQSLLSLRFLAPRWYANPRRVCCSQWEFPCVLLPSHAWPVCTTALHCMSPRSSIPIPVLFPAAVLNSLLRFVATRGHLERSVWFPRDHWCWRVQAFPGLSVWSRELDMAGGKNFQSVMMEDKHWDITRRLLSLIIVCELGSLGAV